MEKYFLKNLSNQILMINILTKYFLQNIEVKNPCNISLVMFR